MTFNLTQWRESIEGSYLDLDNFPEEHPWQCHDVWLSILYALGGQPGEGYAPSGYTDSVFTSFPFAPRLTELFTKHYDIGDVQAGDVIFWEACNDYPLTHVAVALGSVSGEYVPCLTQNPGPVHTETLTTRGALGFLRPRTLAGARTASASAPKDWMNEMTRQFSGRSSRSRLQRIKGGVATYVTFLDTRSESAWGNNTITRGPGPVKAHVTTQFRGKPGTRVEVFLVRERGANKGRTIIAEDRKVVDSYGLTTITLPYEESLASGDLIRVLAQVEKGKAVDVTKFYWRGLVK